MINRPKRYLTTAFWIQSQTPVFIGLFLFKQRQEVLREQNMKSNKKCLLASSDLDKRALENFLHNIWTCFIEPFIYWLLHMPVSI